MTAIVDDSPVVSYEFDFFLVIEPGHLPLVKKKKPALKSGQIATQITMNVPLALFEQPAIKATINVPSGFTGPVEIDVDALQSAIQRQIKMPVTVKVVK